MQSTGAYNLKALRDLADAIEAQQTKEYIESLVLKIERIDLTQQRSAYPSRTLAHERLKLIEEFFHLVDTKDT